MRVTPILGANAVRLLCLACRAVFSPAAHATAIGCPRCGHPRLLQFNGGGTFRLLPANQAAGPSRPPTDQDNDTGKERCP